MFSIKLNYPLFLLMCFIVRLLVQDDFRVHHLGGSFQLFFFVCFRKDVSNSLRCLVRRFTTTLNDYKPKKKFVLISSVLINLLTDRYVAFVVVSYSDGLPFRTFQKSKPCVVQRQLPTFGPFGL